jgi:hypothetical protein
MMRKIGKLRLGAGIFLIILGSCLCVGVSSGMEKSELLKYEVTWNGNQAGHGDITAVQAGKEIKVTAQAVSDGMLKNLVELWSRIQASFTPRTFKPQRYNFALRSSLGNPEIVDLAFDHKTNLVQVNKQKGSETESHAEKFSGLYDPITAIYMLRGRDLTKPLYVDIYDGKDKSRLLVNYVCCEPVTVRAGMHTAMCLNLRLVKLGGDGKEIATGKLWLSNDENRVPLLLTTSPIVGTIRCELVQAKL